MTIDEAILHAREVAEIQRNNDKLNKTLGKSSPYYNTDCIKCAEEHEQLADWLEELKSYRASVFSGDMTQQMLKEEYCKAVDDFCAEICKAIVQSERNCDYRFYAVEIKQSISDLAEKLKAGDVD